jgi:hypothetical protein
MRIYYNLMRKCKRIGRRTTWVAYFRALQVFPATKAFVSPAREIRESDLFPAGGGASESVRREG